MATLLVTAGPTREYLDEVRYLSNGSTGRMGYAIAAAGAAAGHRVVLVSGPTELAAPRAVERHVVTSAVEMHELAVEAFRRADVAFGVAAVADYRPAERRPGKPPRGAERVTVELVPNPDIVAALGAAKGDRVVVGFALEAGTPDQALDRGRQKLRHKHLDLVVVNRLAAVGAADSQATLLYADGRSEVLPAQAKAATAALLVERAIELLAERRPDRREER